MKLSNLIPAVAPLWALVMLPACGGAGEDGRDGLAEVCDDRTDNDGDGHVDCDDQDCWSAADCPGSGPGGDDDDSGGGPFGDDDDSGTGPSGDDDSSGDDDVEPVDADGDGYSSKVDCDDSDPTSTVVSIDADCDGLLTNEDCDDSDPSITISNVGNPDCLGSADFEECGNGFDDDGDGATDCDDSECTTLPECLVEVCDDGSDNDGDGLADCADPDCAGLNACQEICNDGVDTDGDGLIDCSDPDCSAEADCPEDCGNGTDDDADGATDCYDSECSNEPGCDGIESQCQDGQDNDGDAGAIGGGNDCDDLDCCLADPFHCTGMGVCVPELCTPGSGDEDANGLADCDDPACFGLPACTVDGSPGIYQTPDGGPCTIPAATTVSCSVVAGAQNGDVDSADYVVNPHSILDTVVEVTISHSPVGDLILSLQNCGGLVLSAHNGGSGSGYQQTVFDSAAGQSITSGTAPFAGTFAPETYLGQCNGIDVNNLWTLVVDNTSGSAVGTIDSWNITFDLGEVDCSDAVDNDADGDVDCADSDCVTICSP